MRPQLTERSERKLLGRLPAGRQEFIPRHERISTKSANVLPRANYFFIQGITNERMFYGAHRATLKHLRAMKPPINLQASFPTPLSTQQSAWHRRRHLARGCERIPENPRAHSRRRTIFSSTASCCAALYQQPRFYGYRLPESIY